MNLTNLIALFIFIFGTIIGSFLNVLIYRIPLKLDFVKGHSFCPHCHHGLSALDLFPVFSFLFLKGKCRYCGEKISWRYPLIELLTGILFALSYLRFGNTWMSLIGMALAADLVVLSMIDIDTMEFDDGFSIFIVILAILAFVIHPSNLMFVLLGMFVISIPMYILAVLTGGFGGADIKLMGAAGLLLGFPNIIVAFFVGVICGGIQAVFLLKKGKDKKTMMPFGPHLAIGIFIAFLAAQPILDWYLSFFIS
ncbi:MAG: leader peptidase (prepilin peptidase) / N-methyltransferase [Erysipelotrichaceae bacterium]|nr:MAG: leader peptidase (prepilin peptidase) [Erysipelotrichaceae bacterium]TXT18616.1 MAG: leader peptidase (prepilin peptidase) / N-methyltransferase [Erysipelotrichaceae bacterium]